MSHRIGFGIIAAFTALLVLGPSCQKSGQTEMRPASGVNPEYREDEAPLNPPKDREPMYPQPGSGSGVPGTQTTPGATEPGSDSEIPRRRDSTMLQPGGFPLDEDPTTNEEPSDTWGSERTTGGTGNSPQRPMSPGKGSAGHPSR